MAKANERGGWLYELKRSFIRYCIFVTIFGGVSYYIFWSNLSASPKFTEKPPVMPNTYFAITNKEVAGEGAEKATPLSKDAVIQAIDEAIKGGKLEGQGKTYYKAFEDWKVSAMMMAAISIVETSYPNAENVYIPGTSPLIKKSNNIAGVNWERTMDVRTNGVEKIPYPYKRDGWYNVYPSIEDAIDDMARRIRWWYLDMGLDNISKIQIKWAPDSDKRQAAKSKTKMDNTTWAGNVTAHYEKMLKRAKQIQNKGVGKSE